ncbi:MAG: AMP-binding protein [Burkholderiales bacterium]|jgi:acyl-[acyl-carrier-protein]-phospholipid O-acyltransferase/long-chain-fatty-acid--[acyl-carrier-protein] ligase|nr:AMP-binding protein [Burkholderiales bacterium]
MSAVVALLLRLVWRVRVVGDLSGFASARVLIAARHTSALDALWLAYCLPVRPVVIVPREDKRHRLVRWALRWCEHHAWDMNHPMTVKKVVRLLEQGRVVAVFPEGRVTRGGHVMKVYEGAAAIALRSGAHVVPVIAMRGNDPFARGHSRGPVRLHVERGAPIEDAAGQSARVRREQATQALASRLAAATFAAARPRGLYDCFLDAVAREGRSTAVFEDMAEEPKTYGDLLKASLALGRWIERRTAPGESVGVLMPNVFASVGLLLGLARTGRVAAMLNYTAGPTAVAAARDTAALRRVVTSRRFVEQAGLQPLIAALGDVQIDWIEDVRAQFGIGDRLWLVGWGMRFPRLGRARVNPHDPAAILFTSGSEGVPKGVALSHAGIVANIRQIRTVIEFTPADKVLNALPIYHAYSFTAGIWLCLLTGTQLFLYVSPLRYRAIPEIAYRRDVTYLFGTSTFLGFYARHAHPGDFDSLRIVISGGEKLGEDVERLWLERFGKHIHEGYGATECTVISLATPLARRPGRVGRLLPGNDARLEPVEGIADGGVLHVRSPAVMCGYITRDLPGVVQPVRSVLGEGWHRTGDVVAIDADGFLRIAGRVKRFAKIAGEMVSLDQVERVAVAASPDHQHAAVLKLEAAGGETTVLFTTDPQLARSRLQKAARHLAAQDLAVARNVLVVDAIPLLGNGKTDYVKLMEMVTDPASWATGPDTLSGA